MSESSEALLAVLLESAALKFGEFKTKSGRLSPHFVDFGAINNGQTLFAVASLYAEVLAKKWGDEVETLYGPAYKGIPLAIMTSYALALKVGRPIGFTFNRKERKDHGEGGLFVGHSLSAGQRVVIVEDVLTGGTSLRETHALLQPLKLRILGTVVGLDRQERGLGLETARQEVEALYHAPVHSILSLRACLEFLRERPWRGQQWLSQAQYEKSMVYLGTYGCLTQK